MRRTPSLSIGVKAKITALGLQNNNIDFISYAYLSTFPNLQHLDVRGQQTSSGCVYVDFDASNQRFKIDGKNAFISFILTF